MRFKQGDAVQKISGDYRFRGIVVAAFTKLDKERVRYVVENPDGILHIFSESNLDPMYPNKGVDEDGR